MPGVLALPFTTESTGEGDKTKAVLFPDWVAVFYPHGQRARQSGPLPAARPARRHARLFQRPFKKPKTKRPKTPPSHGLTGLAAIKPIAKKRWLAAGRQGSCKNRRAGVV